MTRGRARWLVTAAIAALAWCVLIGGLVGGDPMLVLEIVGGWLLVAWAGLLLRELVGAHRLARAWSVDAREVSLFGVRCHVTTALGSDALVVGSVRPRIFVGAALLAALSDDELRAIVHHEDHHRRTRAPIRAAALAAWLRLLGRSNTARNAILNRLADLETLADADAIRRGSSARSLARALLKADPTPRPASFSFAADRRVAQLLDRAAGIPADATVRLPYEWLPLALVAIATLGCHVGL